MPVAAANQPSTGSQTEEVDLAKELTEAGIEDVLTELDNELVGLAPVKTRIREIAALLLVERVRRKLGLSSEPPTLHMSFTGNPGTGKTTVAVRMADILHRLGFVYRAENERDYGQEAIEILLQVMENQREDLVVILAGYADRMEKFFRSNPGFRSRIAHHIDFPDYADGELLAIGELILARQNYKLSESGREALARYINARKQQPHFSNARSIRNALDRARMRQANRIVRSAAGLKITAEDLMTIDAPDLLASRVFGQDAAANSPLSDETESTFD
jgi:hypothetical protein